MTFNARTKYCILVQLHGTTVLYIKQCSSTGGNCTSGSIFFSRVIDII